MKSAGYVPDCGDAIWLNFDPQTGREQAERRPEKICDVPEEIVEDVVAKISALIGDGQ